MFDVTHILQAGGLLLVGLFLFAEVGLFLGFFLPGDTLLIAAGIYAKQGKLDLVAVIIVAALAATAGDNTSYWIGRKLGRKVFQKEDSVIFKHDHMLRAEAFYERHGSKTILMAHFIPVIRTFSPLLAGVGKMDYKKFLTFDVVGDSVWAIVVTLAGYYLGSRIPNIDHYLVFVFAGVIIVSLSPTLYQVGKLIMRKHRAGQAGPTGKK